MTAIAAASLLSLPRAELQAGGVKQSCESIRRQLQKQDHADLHVQLGDCEEALGNFREAANQYQIAARAEPTEQNLFAFGSELLKYRGYREALQVFSFSTDRYPKSGKLRVGLGVTQYSLGQYENAVESLCRAVDLHPEDARALEFLGKMIGIAPELSKQVEMRLARFARIYPKNAAANYYYAMSLRARPSGERPNAAAKQSLLVAVSLDPTFAEAHYELGLIYGEDRLSKRAISEFEKAIRYRPQMSAAHYKVAQLYAQEGQAERARQEFEAVRNLRSH